MRNLSTALLELVQPSSHMMQETLVRLTIDDSACTVSDVCDMADDTSLGSKAAESVASPSTTSALEGQEPISGEQGVGTAAKPFDAGNNGMLAISGCLRLVDVLTL